MQNNSIAWLRLHLVRQRRCWVAFEQHLGVTDSAVVGHLDARSRRDTAERPLAFVRVVYRTREAKEARDVVRARITPKSINKAPVDLLDILDCNAVFQTPQCLHSIARPDDRTG